MTGPGKRSTAADLVDLATALVTLAIVWMQFRGDSAAVRMAWWSWVRRTSADAAERAGRVSIVAQSRYDRLKA